MEYLNRITKDVFRDKLNLDDDQLLTNWIFADYQRKDKYDEYGDLEEEAPFVYEAAPDTETMRNITMTKLELHNEKNPSKKMDLVIFDDALYHLIRVTRVINAPSGNMLLVGVGGSGKKSLSKLAAFICKHVFFQISLTKTYNDQNLKDDIRALYTAAGPQGKQVAFCMTDAEIKKESFLEAINAMLATGEIPGLIPKEDKDIVAIECKNIWVKEEGVKGQEPPLSLLWNFFLRRVKDCLHMILAFSPVGKAFRERASNFPSLFSQCNIDWFLPWPEEALVAVAQKFLRDGSIKLDAEEEVKTELEKHMGKCHNIVADMCDVYLARMRRHVYVTPKSYLSFIAIYKTVYEKEYKKIDVEANNITNGLDKLAEASESISALLIISQKEEAELKEASAATDKLLFTLNIESKKAKEKSDQVNATTIQLGKDKDIVMADKAAAEEDLANALPFLRQAE
jgi:dynein heavy chain